MSRYIGIVLLVLIVFGALFVQVASASDAVMAYRSSTNQSYCTAASALNCPKLRFWNSSGSGSWGSEIELPSAGSPVREAVVKYSNVSQKAILVTQSDDGYLDSYVCISNCTDAASWVVTNNIGSVWSSAPATHSRRFDVEFETATGRAIVVYGVNDTNTTHDLAYKVLPAGPLNFSGITEQYINDASQSMDVNYSWVSLDRKPNTSSNELVLAGFNLNNNTVNAWVWNGSSWGNQQDITTTASGTNGYEDLAVKYAGDGSKGMVVAGGQSGGQRTNLAGYYWNGTGWTSTTVTSIVSGGRTPQWLTMKADPSSDDLQVVETDDGPRMSTAYWNGTAWAVTQDIDTAVDSATTRVADFEWNATGNAGVLFWDTDGAGTTLSQRNCTPQCNGTTSTISGYAGTGAWLALYSNPTTADQVKILGGRMNDTRSLGSFSWNMTASSNYGDSSMTANNSNVSMESFSIAFQLSNATVDTTPPVVILSTPANGYTSDSTTVTFNFTATDDTSAAMSCSVYLDGILNYTNSSVLNNTPAVSTKTLALGIHNWSVVCSDQAGNTNSPDTWNFTVADNCPIITSSYAMFNNFTGAPNSASPLGGTACVKIIASNLVFDCNGYSITNNGTGGTTYGILLNGSKTNVTVKNCAGISGYSDGVYIYSSNFSNFTNIRAFNNTQAGFYASSSTYNVFTSNNASGNGYEGFFLNANSNANNVTNNTADHNLYSGIHVATASMSNRITGNNVTYTGCPSTYHLSQLSASGTWEERYAEPFDAQYSTKPFGFYKVGDRITVRISQYGNMPFADIDQIRLVACGAEIAPEYARYTDSGQSVLDDILAADHNVVIAHAKTIEASWSIPASCSEEAVLSLTANEYADGLPVYFPLNGYAPVVDSGFVPVIDGSIAEVDGIVEPAYSPFWAPQSGHPAGYAYIYTSEDSQNVYISLDATPDNTDEAGDDWAEVAFASASGDRVFRVDAAHEAYGKCAFGMTSKVSYEHKTCEFSIPKAEIGGSSAIFRLRYHGTVVLEPAGILLESSNYNVVDNNRMSNTCNGTGAYVYGSTNNNLTDNVAYNNSFQGFWMYIATSNTLFNNTAYDNGMEDFMLSSSTLNTLSSNNATNQAVTWIYGYYLISSNSNNLTNNIAQNNNGGTSIYLLSSSYNTLSGNNASDCNNWLFALSGSSFNNLTNNNAKNGYAGFIAGGGSNSNNLISNNASGDTIGFYLWSGSNNNLINNLAYNSTQYGVFIYNGATGNQFWNTTLYGNAYGLYVNSSTAITYNMTNTTFLNPSGTPENYTALYINDTLGAGEAYYVNWTTNSSALPNRNSFAQKFLDMTRTNGTVSIDSMAWGWQDTELSGYNESSFELWKYNASGWTKVNATRDTTADTLTAANVNPASIFGILEVVPTLAVSLATPAQGAMLNYSNVTFSFAAVSNSDPTFNCYAYLDGSLNRTIAGYSNGTTANFSITGLAIGGHNWSVSCNDSVLSNVSEVRNLTVDMVPPSIDLSTPAAGYLTNSTDVLFSYTPTDDFADNMTCRLYVDAGLLGTFTVNNNTLRSDTYSRSEGYHTWYVSCTDQAGNTNTSATRNFTIDLTPPSIALNSPPNLYLTNDSAVTFNFTATDSRSPTMNCSVWVDGGLSAYNNNVPNNTAFTFGVSPGEGQHNWYIQCTDLANNTNVSATRNLTVDLTPPSIAIAAPADGNTQNTTGVTFSYTPTDNFATTITCSLYADSGLLGTFSVPNNTLRSDTYYFGSGNHTWYVNCTDQANNTNISETRWFIIDLPPTVALNAPADGARIVSGSPVNATFNFTPSDDNSTTLNCTFYLDGAANQTFGSAANGTPVALNATLSVTSHTWYVRCTDGAGSTGTSPTYNILVSQTAGVSTSGGGEELKRFTLSASSSCPGDLADVYAYTSGGPLAGATVRVVLYDPYEGLVGQNSTDSSGHVHIGLPSAGTYEVTALKPGYANPSMVSFAFTPCARAPGQNVTLPPPQPGGNATPPTNVTQPPANQTMGQAQQAITDAGSAISDAAAAGKDVSGARSKLADAQSAFDAGNYQQALELANEAKQLALNAAAPPPAVKPPVAPTPTPTPTTPAPAGFDWMPVIILVVLGVVIIAVAAGAYMLFGTKKGSRK